MFQRDKNIQLTQRYNSLENDEVWYYIQTQLSFPTNFFVREKVNDGNAIKFHSHRLRKLRLYALGTKTKVHNLSVGIWKFLGKVNIRKAAFSSAGLVRPTLKNLLYRRQRPVTIKKSDDS